MVNRGYAAFFHALGSKPSSTRFESISVDWVRTFNPNVDPSRVLAGVIRHAACYRLISSDLPETCNLLTRMVEESKREQVRCA